MLPKGPACDALQVPDLTFPKSITAGRPMIQALPSWEDNSVAKRSETAILVFKGVLLRVDVSALARYTVGT